AIRQIRDLVAARIDNAQVFEPRLGCVQDCRRKVHAHESLGWNVECLYVTPFVRIERRTRLPIEDDCQRKKNAEAMEQVRSQYSFHCFSRWQRETADKETTPQWR